jgi:predicted amidohydrolase YtcJ
VSNLILTNANVITMNPALPRAGFIAIKDGVVMAVGRENAINLHRDRETRLINCAGRTIVPGFIDAHLHLRGYAENLLTLNLEPRQGVRSISDIQRKVRQHARNAPPGSWIRGRGYDEFHLAEKRSPSRTDLDGATTTHPVSISHRSGYAHVLNTFALRLIGISNETGDPQGGLIERDLETGEPTGLLYGMGDFISQSIPSFTEDELAHSMQRAGNSLCQLGITSVHDASSRNTVERLRVARKWKDDGLLKQRVNMLLGVKGFDECRERGVVLPENNRYFRTTGVKVITDETTGRLNPDQSELNAIVLRIHESGYQAVIHAIEEQAIAAACSAIEKVLRESPRHDHRHRIEHCSVCRATLAQRIASLGITVVTQPSFIYFNGERYLETVPKEDLEHLYSIGTLMKNGVSVAGSSDCPVVPANPLTGIYAAVTRKSETGKPVAPEEGITAYEALCMYTIGAARAGMDETITGSLVSGKAGDLVVLTGDPTSLPEEEIKNIEVEMTIIDGEIVWEKM